MKSQGNKEFGQDLGELKVQNPLDGIVCLNKTIFTKKYAVLLAAMLNALAACHTLVRSLLNIFPQCGIK